MTRPWIFMGIDRSHFSAKLRPVIRYKEIHCVEYPPDPKMIQARTGTGFVPVLLTPDDQLLQDTTDIIDVLEQQFPDPLIIPNDALDQATCRLFELYADEFFPMVSMRTRWAYPENEAELRRAFAAFSGAQERGNKVADLMSSYLPALGITKETIPAIDAHTEELLALLDAHFSDQPFLLGDRMSLADCALMGPLYAHLYLDRVTRKQLYDTALNVCMWIERCNRPVPASMGNWYAGDYPASLTAILELIGRDAAPLLLDLRAAFTEWATSDMQPGKPLPRGAGSYRSQLRGVKVDAGVRTYVSWKMQRLLDNVASQSPTDEARVAAAFATVHCGGLLANSEAPRLRKQDFQLVPE